MNDHGYYDYDYSARDEEETIYGEKLDTLKSDLSDAVGFLFSDNKDLDTDEVEHYIRKMAYALSVNVPKKDLNITRI